MLRFSTAYEDAFPKLEIQYILSTDILGWVRSLTEVSVTIPGKLSIFKKYLLL